MKQAGSPTLPGLANEALSSSSAENAAELLEWLKSNGVLGLEGINIEMREACGNLGTFATRDYHAGYIKLILFPSCSKLRSALFFVGRRLLFGACLLSKSKAQTR
jgi:hypothetical protein